MNLFAIRAIYLFDKWPRTLAAGKHSQPDSLVNPLRSRP